MNKKRFIKTLSLIVSIIILACIAALYFVFKYDVTLSLVVAVVFIIILLIVYFSIDTMQNEASKEIEKKLDTSTKLALSLSKTGILVYSEEYEITWMSEFFTSNHIEHVGEKLLNWIPELQNVLEGQEDSTTVVINDEKYRINKLANASVLIFTDITNEYDAVEKLNNNAYVLGLVMCDNYDESLGSDEELAYINLNIKTPVIEYFKKFGCAYKTLKNNCLMIVLNESIYEQIYEDRFSILKDIRTVAAAADLDVSLSMAFARGSDNLSELDEMVMNLLELAQTRGGDQVVVRKVGEDALFFGGNTEAREKLNKTKVRANANTIKDLINKSSKVIIVGHKNADADCIGAAICMSNIVNSLDKKAYIVYDKNDVDSMIDDVVNKYKEVLDKKHNLISEIDALDMIDDDTLVVMVDHHIKEQSNAANLLEKANVVIIIDHHRRKADLDTNPIMFYCEASASSTCEMICEFLPYMPKKLAIEEEEANIMYLGILIDTDRFRNRTGTRTFDVAKQLKHYGADPLTCDELAQEPYNNVINRSNIISAGKSYGQGIIISSLNEGTYSRPIISQACDVMVKAKEIDAAFVICNGEDNEVVVSARSNGKINVQIIMEKMNGGGHMTAAGLQRKDTTVAKVENELLNVLDEYFKGDQDESNIVK